MRDVGNDDYECAYQIKGALYGVFKTKVECGKIPAYYHKEFKKKQEYNFNKL